MERFGAEVYARVEFPVRNRNSAIAGIWQTQEGTFKCSGICFILGLVFDAAAFRNVWAVLSCHNDWGVAHDV